MSKLLNRFIPSSNLRQLPTVPPLSYIGSLLKDEPSDVRNLKHVIPQLNSGGGLCKLWLGTWFINVSSPKLITDLVSKKVAVKLKDENYYNNESIALQFVGRNLADVYGLEWQRRRKAITPTFMKRWSTEKFNEPCTKILDIIEREGNNENFDISLQLKNLTLDGLGLYIFDIDFNTLGGKSNEIATLYNHIMSKMENILLLMYPTITNKFKSTKLLKLKIERFRTLIQQLIDTKTQQIEDGEPGDDMITLMLLAKDENNNRALTNKEIIDDTILFFSAGHDTTANTLSFVLYYLAKHPQVQNKLYEEIVNAMKNNDDSDGNGGVVPSTNQINKMDYCLAVIYETMRINPVVNQLIRQVDKEYKVSEHFTLKKDQLLMFNLTTAMRDEKLTTEADQFRPERFLDGEGKFDKEKGRMNMGFGLGQRSCLGMGFSLLEQKVVLAAIMSKFRVELPVEEHKDKQPIIKSMGFMNIRNLKLKFLKRSK